jgi:putative peptidoglycan lipid II flippase
MTIAYLFGAGRETDSFIVAFRIPNLMRDLFAEGGLSAAFVPTFTRYLTKEGRSEAFRLASITINLILVVVGGVVIVGIFVAPHLVKVIAYGFADVPGKMALTLTMTRILFPFLLLVSLAAVAMGILNSLKHFFIPAIAPAGFNLSIILAGVVAAPLMPRIGMEPIVSIAIGAVIGGLLQIGIQIPLLLKEGLRYRPTLNLAHPGLREIAAIYFPATFGLMASKVNMVINTFLATLLAESTVSHLTFSFRIMNFPLGLFGVAVATVALPSLSGAAASNDMIELKNTLVRGLRLSLFLMIPSSLFLIFLSRPIIALIYQRGRFLEGDTHPTSQALMLYSIGLFAIASVRLLAYCFYSLKDARTPMKISFVAVAVNVGLNLSLMYHIGFRAFPISASSAAVLQMTLLWYSLRKRLGDLPLSEILLFAAKVALAALVMGVCAKFVYSISPSGLGFAASAVSGGAIFLLISRLWGLPEGATVQRLLLRPQEIWSQKES